MALASSKVILFSSRNRARARVGDTLALIRARQEVRKRRAREAP
jgi:hypothetical protein